MSDDVIELEEGGCAEHGGKFLLMEVTRGYAWECFRVPRRAEDGYLYRITGGLNGSFKEFIMRDGRNFVVGGCVWSEQKEYALLFDGKANVRMVMRSDGDSCFGVYRLAEAIDKHTALMNADFHGNGIVRETKHFLVQYTNDRDVTVKSPQSRTVLFAGKEKKTYRIQANATKEFALALLTMFTARHLIKLFDPRLRKKNSNTEPKPHRTIEPTQSSRSRDRSNRTDINPHTPPSTTAKLKNAITRIHL